MNRQEDFRVQGMTCGGCENSVKRALANLPGVTNVTANHQGNQVVVDVGDGGAGRDQLAAAIEAAGFDVENG